MGIIIFNVSWMLYNISLACIAVLFGFFMLKAKPLLFKIVFAIIWLLFIPNSIYMLTDIIHLYKDLQNVNFFYQILLILQYFLLMTVAIITFILSLLPFEELLIKKSVKKYITASMKPLLIFGLNFVIAFGVVLGRIQRLNSWDIITNLPGVLQNIFHILVSANLLLLTVFFGVLCNIVYFSYRFFHNIYITS